MIKRANFSHLEVKVIEECIKSDIYPSEIAEMLGKEESAIRRKMWKMGIRCPKKVHKRTLTEEEKLEFRKKAAERQAQEAKNKMSLRFSMHPFLNPDWQEILSITGARVGLWRGEKTLILDGIPASIHQIRSRYEELTSSPKCPEESAAV